MEQFYLIKQDVLGRPRNVDLAESFIKKEVTLNPWLLIPLEHAIDVVSQQTLDENGEISSLIHKKKYGKEYYCIEADHFELPEGIKNGYEVLKKIRSKDHVYEIRLKLEGKDGETINCRILMTINTKEPYFIWTYGFSKRISVWFQYGGMTANKLTDVMSNVTHRIYTSINETNDEEYVGRRGERHEVE